MCKANACFWMERLRDCSIESATAVTFSCAVLVLGRPDLLLFNADDVCRKLETQRCIVFLLVRDHDDLMKSVFGRNAASLRLTRHSLQALQ